MKAYHKLASRYMKEVRAGERVPKDDLLTFTNALVGRAVPKGSIAGYQSAVRNFLLFHEIEIPRAAEKMIKRRLPKGNGTASVEDDLTSGNIRQILHHADPPLRALLLVLCSSGTRIEEALSLDMHDIDLSRDPVEVIIRGETSKGGATRFTFISSEAKEAVTEWLKLREKFLITSAIRASRLRHEKAIEDGRLFPMSYEHARKLLRRALSDAGIYRQDRITKRSTMHFHQTRKWFLSQFQVHGSRAIGKLLAGHSGYPDNSYRRISKTEVIKEYKKMEPHLSVLGSGELRNIMEQYQATRAAMLTLEQEKETLSRKVAELEQRQIIQNELLSQILKSAELKEVLKNQK
jgi:site-specific recombinase XerD